MYEEVEGVWKMSASRLLGQLLKTHSGCAVCTSFACFKQMLINANMHRLCVYSFVALLIIAGGCTSKEASGFHIGHSSYSLGCLSFSKSNDYVDTEFVMPDASHVFVCLVLDDTDISDAHQTQDILRSLRGLKLHLEMFNADCASPSWRTTLAIRDLGQVANWYAPDWAFVINPPLITYGTGRVVVPHTNNIDDSEGMDFRPGEKYRLLLKVQEPVGFTNNIQIRMDFWGVQVGKREKGDSVIRGALRTKRETK